METNRKAGKYKWMKRYAMLLTGSLILSFGLYNIHSRSSITEGGVLGMQLLIQHWTGISPGISGILMDLLCYAAGVRLLGFAFLKNACVVSLSYSFFYHMHERCGYLLPDLAGNAPAAAILGGIFVGIGVGLVVRAGGASGGDDALALVMNRLSGIRLERCYLLTDFTVLFLSLSYISWRRIIWSLLSVSISSYMIGHIYQGKKDED